MQRKDSAQGSLPILGIESSCDETAVAILSDAGEVLAARLLSQLADHAPYGGVVPEIAARAHLASLPAMVADALHEAGLTFGDLGAIAATAGPGLIGGLLIGTGYAKGAAIGAGIAYMAINHMEAHALTARLPGLCAGQPAFPYLVLLLSGGHSQCVRVGGVGDYEILGETLDDAVGEAFDKTAKLLGLPYPGGPAVERLAAGRADRFALPRPLRHRPGCDFSFSGLKTAVAQLVATQPPGPLGQDFAADVAASFQAAVGDVLADRVAHALAMAPGMSGLVAAGGVAANLHVRTRLTEAADAAGIPFYAPPLSLCGDNAVMIAWAAIERRRAGLTSDLAAPCRPRWRLGTPA
jgi:N6-L-threonylcarbamoyladenine synthase